MLEITKDTLNIFTYELEFLYIIPALKEKGFKDCMDSLMSFFYANSKTGREDWEKSK